MGLKHLAVAIGTAFLGSNEAEVAAASETSPNCFEYNYDYNGHDIHQVPFVMSPAICLDECAAHRGCAFWTYDTVSRMCYLKSADAFTERRPASMMVSGPRQCTFSSSCYEAGVDYYGYDIEKVEGRYVMNPVDCQRLCTGNPQCAFFSWKFSTHSCFLKSASAFLNRREDPDVTSGPRVCSNKGHQPPHATDYPTEFDPSTAPPPCIESGVEYKGHTIVTANKGSAAACQSECQKRRECHFWTWSSQRRICSLKDANARNGRIENQGTLDKVSGARDCIPVRPGCQYADVGIVGARLNSRSAASFDVCQLYCASFAGCTHFSYDLNSGSCTMWSSFDTYSKGNSTEGLVSGPAFCDSEETCYEQSDYVGFNVEEDETGDIKSPAACQALCRKNPECHYWTWLRTNKGCYLKDANAILGRTNNTTSLGRFSGPKWCTVSYGCVSINSVYTGLSFQQGEATDYEACAASCRANAFCTAWTYHTELGFCSLFAGSPSLAQTPVRGALSGDKECAKQEEEEENCFEEGIFYDLDDLLRIADVQSADECYEKCLINDTCTYWSLKNGNECYLLKSPRQPSFVFDPNCVSGPGECPSGKPYFTDNVEYAGGDLGSYQAYTIEGCIRKCEQTAKCAFWSFNYKALVNSCSLFDETASVQVTTPGPEIQSGRVLPVSMVASGCTFSDPISSVTVSKPMECQEECQFNELCEAWQSQVEVAEGAGVSRVTCTFFQSADNPTRVQGSNIKCGTKILPGKLLVHAMEGPTSTVNAETIPKCISACSEDDAITFWSFSARKNCSCFEQKVTATNLTGISGEIKRTIPSILFNISYSQPAKRAPASLQLRSGFRRRLAASQGGVQVSSLNDCISLCSNESTCTSWTFKDNKCSIFREAMIPMKEERAISGRKSTPQLEWTFDLGKKFLADPQKSWPAKDDSKDDPNAANLPPPETAMECAGRAEQGQCWSFKDVESGDSICYIFATCDQLGDEAGFVSGKADASQGSGQGPDAGRVQGPDAGRVQGPDAGRVQGPDAGRAQGPDAGRAQGPDAGQAQDPDALP